MHKFLKMLQFPSIFTIKDGDVILKKMVDIALQNDTKHKYEHEYLMLIIDFKISNKVKTTMETRIGKWLRKDSNDSDKIIMNLKHKRKKRLEKCKTHDFKEDLRWSTSNKGDYVKFSKI